MNHKTDNKMMGNLAAAHSRKVTNIMPTLRNTMALFAMSMLVIVVMSGCAKTTITDRDEVVTGKLQRPTTIWIYDFAASAADIPPHSILYSQNMQDTPNQTNEQTETGHKLGREIATELVSLIKDMGLLAARGGHGTVAQINDIEIRGYLVSFSKGDTAKRVGLGLGAGASELKAVVEGFQMTSQGLRKLGSGDTDAKGSKTPGMGVGLLTMLATHNPVGLIVSTGMKAYGEESGKATVEGRAKQIGKEVADVLKKRFEQEGWIE